MAKPFKRKDSRFWWIAPWIDGVQVPQSSKTEDYFEAWDKLRSLEGKVADGVPITPQSGRALVKDLVRDVETDYANKELTSIADLKARIKKHIVPAIGHLRADQIKPSTIREYIRRRKEQKAKNATVNRELAILKRAFRLGYPEKVSYVPEFPKLPENNARETAFTEAQFRAILHHANQTLRDFLTIAYYTGWRKRSILSLEWRHVDLKAGFLYLEGSSTKNRKAARCPLSDLPELKTTLEAMHERTKATERQKEMRIPYVFHRDGERVRSIRTAFSVARRKAGVPGHVIHDFRRTAVRELNAAGVDLQTIMDFCGFKTHQMVLRYIGQTPEARLREAAQKRQARKL